MSFLPSWQADHSSRAFNFGEFVDGRAQQSVPAALADDEPRLAAFYDHCFGLCLTLNDLLGIGLEVGGGPVDILPSSSSSHDAD